MGLDFGASGAPFSKLPALLAEHFLRSLPGSKRKRKRKRRHERKRKRKHKRKGQKPRTAGRQAARPQGLKGPAGWAQPLRIAPPKLKLKL